MAGLVLTICGVFIALAVLVVCVRWPSETPEADACLKAEHEARFERALGWPPGSYESDVAERLASNERWAADQIAAPDLLPEPKPTQVSTRIPGTYPVMPEDMPSVPEVRPATSDVIGIIPGPRKGMHFDVRLHAWDLAPPVGDVPAPHLSVEIFNPAAMGLGGEVGADPDGSAEDRARSPVAGYAGPESGQGADGRDPEGLEGHSGRRDARGVPH